jgi:hypothetical protein
MRPINEGGYDPRIINEHFHDQLFSYEDRSLSIDLEKEDQCFDYLCKIKHKKPKRMKQLVFMYTRQRERARAHCVTYQRR